MGLTAAQAARLQEAQAIAAQVQAIVELPQQEFVPATRPVASRPAVSELREFEKQRVAAAKKATSWFAFGERREAVAQAKRLARDDFDRAQAWAGYQQVQQQAELDGLWQRLNDNDPDVVVETLNEAFADNEAPAVCVGVDGATASVVVVAPDLDDVVPERQATITDAGNLSLRKMSKTDRNQLYCAVVYGHVLVSAKEAFAVAPGLRSVVVMAVTRPGRDVYGNPRRPDVLVAASVSRASLEGVQWHHHTADVILLQVADELAVNRKGRAGELHPIDLDTEPAFAVVAELVDADV